MAPSNQYTAMPIAGHSGRHNPHLNGMSLHQNNNREPSTSAIHNTNHQQQQFHQNINNSSATFADEPNKLDHIIAAKALTSKICEDDQNDELYFERAICYHNIENFNDSLSDIEAAINLNPTNYNYFYQKGMTLFSLNRRQNGYTAFKKSIELLAKQEDSKLSDILSLLSGASKYIESFQRRKATSSNDAIESNFHTQTNIDSNQQSPTQALDSQQQQHSPRSNQHNTYVTLSTPDSQVSKLPSSSTSLTPPISDSSSNNFEQIKLQQETHHSSSSSSSSNNQTKLPATHSNAACSSHQDNDQSIKNGQNAKQSINTQNANDNVNDKAPVFVSQELKDQASNKRLREKDFDVLCRSARYKRLKRDRERARRGCSEQCQIEIEDLDKVERSRKPLKVIAPINGWLYNGELISKDQNRKEPHYVIKLEGDETNTSYIFSQESLLKDVIKAVKINSVTDLRKGARICCFWSRQHKCMTTGIVTSRTFNQTKSLVSVKYDNGDLSALPIEDLRLLPPDYPKFFSNTEPLQLVAKHSHKEKKIISSTLNSSQTANTSNPKPKSQPKVSPTITKSSEQIAAEKRELKQAADSLYEFEDSNLDDSNIKSDTKLVVENISKLIDPEPSNNTDKTNDTHTVLQDRSQDLADTRNNNSELMPINNYPQPALDYMSSGIEYRPWIFEFPLARPKRKKYKQIFYKQIRRGNEVIQIGDSAELMPKDSSILPFVAQIESFWATSRGEMKVRVRWYYRAIETDGEPLNLIDVDNALFETKHCDENDVQSIYKSTLILPWPVYNKSHRGHLNITQDHNTPKVFYLAGYYNPVNRLRQLSDDVKNDAISIMN